MFPVRLRIRRARTATVALVAACALPAIAMAQNPLPVAQPAAQPSVSVPAAGQSSSRPRIGLVLAGGGAKGGAHVGVLKVLEELRVPVSCIAGTSMGALVGAGYASGIPAAELQERSCSASNGRPWWAASASATSSRSSRSAPASPTATTSSSGSRTAASSSPGGLVNTSGIEDLLRSYVARARMQSSFDRLPIPFRAVATDMVTGEMVVIDQGDLATAMRASMAIPGAFAPVITDEHILADGGMVRNIPVDVARKLCADVVIVVNLVEPPAQREKLQSATQLVSRSMDVMLQANETLQLQTLTDRDVRIDVFMGDIGTADFERVPETIPLGEAAAREAAARPEAIRAAGGRSTWPGAGR